MKLITYRHAGPYSHHLVIENALKILAEIDLPKDGERLHPQDVGPDICTKLFDSGLFQGPVQVFPEGKSSIYITGMSDDKTGLCIQTGNFARVYADLMKLQAMYVADYIEQALIVVPSKAMSVRLGSNIASYDRLTRELPDWMGVYYCPTTVVGFEA
jgi:hypothetical protein